MGGIGISIFVAAVGAILRYAVTAPVEGFDIHAAGVILMFVGGIGLLLSMLFWSSFAPFSRRNRSHSRREEIVTQDGHEQGRVVRETRENVAD